MRKVQLHLRASSGWCQTPSAPAARSLKLVRSWLAEPSLSEELSSPLPPSPWLRASGQPRRRASSTPPTLLHPSLTAGRSRLTHGQAAAPSRRRTPWRAVPLQKGWHRGSEKPPVGRAAEFPLCGRATGRETRARAHEHTHPPSHTRNRLGQGREEEGDVASHGVTLTSRIPGTLWRGR